MAQKASTKRSSTSESKPKIVTSYDSAITYFSNMVGMTVTENGEMRLDFAEERRSEKVHNREVLASVYITMVTAKRTAGVMSSLIASYEETYGEIPLEPKKKK